LAFVLLVSRKDAKVTRRRKGHPKAHTSRKSANNKSHHVILRPEHSPLALVEKPREGLQDLAREISKRKSLSICLFRRCDALAY
jgi:hypothetical protein